MTIEKEVFEPYKGWQVEVIASCCCNEEHKLRVYRDKIEQQYAYHNYIIEILRERLTFWHRIKEMFRQIKFYLFQYYWEKPKEEIQITPEQAIDLSQKLKNDAQYFIKKQEQVLQHHKYMVKQIEKENQSRKT